MYVCIDVCLTNNTYSNIHNVTPSARFVLLSGGPAYQSTSHIVMEHNSISRTPTEGIQSWLILLLLFLLYSWTPVDCNKNLWIVSHWWIISLPWHHLVSSQKAELTRSSVTSSSGDQVRFGLLPLCPWLVFCLWLMLCLCLVGGLDGCRYLWALRLDRFWPNELYQSCVLLVVEGERNTRERQRETRVLMSCTKATKSVIQTYSYQAG